MNLKWVLPVAFFFSAAFGQGANDGACVLSSSADGKELTVRGKVSRTMHDMLLVIPDCRDPVVLMYAGEADDALHGTSSSSIGLPRHAPLSSSATLTLRKDREFRKFARRVEAFYPSSRRTVRIGCYKYEVSATFTGRLDVSEKVGLIRGEDTREFTSIDGFGHPIPFTRYRLVIESVTDVQARRTQKMGD